MFRQPLVFVLCSVTALWRQECQEKELMIEKYEIDNLNGYSLLEYRSNDVGPRTMSV